MPGWQVSHHWQQAELRQRSSGMTLQKRTTREQASQLVLGGGCLCGAVRYQVTGPALDRAAVIAGLPQGVVTAAYFRARAEEARAVANGMFDSSARETMFQVAGMWDVMAKREEAKSS